MIAMKSFCLFAVLLCLLLQACGMTGMLTSATQRPAGCEQSLIYDHLPAPKLSGTVILIAVSELARSQPKAQPYLLGAIDAILKLLEDDQLTYVELASASVQQVAWVNEYFGNRLLVYSEILSAFDQPIPLYPCDRDLIQAHLTKQRVLLQLGARQ